MHQWYQSSRSSAVLQKNEKGIEVETGNYPLHHYNQHRGYSEICGIDSKNFSTRVTVEEKSVANFHEPKNINESIDQKTTEIRRMIADMTSIKINYSDFSSKLNFQVSLESGNSELHKQYKVYSSYELNEKRDRGICLLCDEYMYLGHKCCKKKKFYVFEIDVDDALEVSECNVSESFVNVELVEKKVVDFDENLTGHGIQSDSILVKNLTSENKIEGEEGMNRVGDNDHKAENVELQVFEELPNKDLPQNVTEKCKSNTLENMTEKCGINSKDIDNKRLRILDDVILRCLVVSTTTKVVCLDDVCSGEWMAILITNPSSKGVGSLHKLHEMLEAQSWVVEWREPPLPPPEPPPGLSYTVFSKENKPENLE
ncbi:hypothetical protein ACJIZ3_021441 [Penstemon smallii]|uniref:Uncharacterized protein n=1 Tax=Penstemon smallii TaxID=265156 RepID=A0ABD3SMA5_9LAMI